MVQRMREIVSELETVLGGGDEDDEVSDSIMIAMDGNRIVVDGRSGSGAVWQ